jgi:hypothetical protein
MTQQQITDLVAPAAVVQQQMSEWLEQSGATQVKFVANRDALVAHFPLSALEAAFQVVMHVYVPGPALRAALPAAERRALLRATTDPVLPPHLQEHIQLIHGIRCCSALTLSFSLSSLSLPWFCSCVDLQTTCSMCSDFPPVTKRTAGRMARAAASAAAASAPSSASAGGITILRARGREGQVQVTFSPVCLNGQPSHALPPCSDQGAAVTGVSLTATTTINPVQATYATGALTPSMCSLVSNAVQCMVVVKVKCVLRCCTPPAIISCDLLLCVCVCVAVAGSIL